MVFEIVVARFGGDGKARGNGKVDARHLGQAGAFAAQQVFHLAVAIRFSGSEEIDVFHIHLKFAVPIRRFSRDIRNSRLQVTDEQIQANFIGAPTTELPLYIRYLELLLDASLLK